MKRSEINLLIDDALHFFSEMNFKLPPWATWDKQKWTENKPDCKEIFENSLGWDITDFGLGSYAEYGLLLFTLRNGNIKRDKKSYAEKIMIVGENQLTPMHFHWTKMEDIINRGGGHLCIELYPSGKHAEVADHPFKVILDGIERSFNPGDTVCLQPGESITLYPGLYHKFYGEKGKGRVLVGEVSSVNDDKTDNRFLDGLGRFPDIEEDSTQKYLLVGDYSKLN